MLLLLSSNIIIFKIFLSVFLLKILNIIFIFVININIVITYYYYQ